jgi:hypothetical protein
MKFGGLSESDISEILAVVFLEVVKDQEIEEFNQSSMKTTCIHYSPPVINHVLL